MLNLSTEQLAGMNCHYIRYSFQYFLDSMVANGLRNIEIWGASPHYFADDYTDEQVRNLKREIEARDLHLVCLTPEQVTYPINIAAREDDLRHKSVANHLRTLDHAAILGVKRMLLTPGYGYLDEPRAEAWKRSRDSIHTIAVHAAAVGVTIALEHLSPASSNLVNTAQDLRQMLDDVSHPSLKAMFDVGQVNILHETVREYFHILGSDIVHAHLVDGTPGGHLALGDGTIPLAENLRDMSEAGYQGYLSMEIADRRYFADPADADRRSIAIFKALIEESYDGRKN